MSPLTPPSLVRALQGLPRDPVAPPPGEMIQAAVSLVLREPEPVDVLLIKRARSPRDPWSGHMALPGGRMEAGDPHLLATAVRETMEETGVTLETGAAFLGRLPSVSPASARLPHISIAPHVFLAREPLEAFAASGEVAAVHWIPLETFRTPGVLGEVQIDLPGGTRSFPCYRVAGEVVWGLTFRILSEFLGRLSSPDSPAIRR